MKKINHSHLIFITTVSLCIASLIFISLTLINHIRYKYSIIQQAKSIVQSEADRTVKEIEAQISLTKTALETIQTALSSGKLSNTNAALAKKLEGALTTDPNIIKIGVVYTTTTPIQKPEHQTMLYERKEGRISAVQDNTPVNYADEEWYVRALKGGAGWSEPSLDKAAKSYITVFSMPLYAEIKESENNGKTPVGVLYAQISLAWLKDKMNTLTLEKNDFGIILSKNGTILYHPLNELVYEQTNIFKFLEARKFNSNNFERQRAIMQKAVNGESGEGYNVGRTGESFWYFYRPVRSTGWTVVINFTKNAVPLNGKILRQQQIRIASGLLIFITFLFILLSRLYDIRRFNKHAFWCLSVIFSLLCVTVACFTWYLSFSIPLSEYQQNKIVVDDTASLDKFLASNPAISQAIPGKEPAYIPTGIYIQSLEFASSNNIEISGYVWQRYTKGRHDGIARGFVMPEAKTMMTNEVYRLKDQKEEVIGWYFQTTIRQKFNYTKYPFDHPDISIWLRTNDFTHNVILIPDLGGYRSTSATALPGLQSRLALPGYYFTGTFFSYEPKMLNANFGITGNEGEIRSKELFYNIIIKRNFMTPLVSKIFPILIVISMLFVVILSFSTDLEKRQNFGLTGLAVVGLVISFFFTTLLTQINLRQELSSDSIIFIENFNFITYFILLLSALQAFFFSAGKKTKFIQFEHCLIPKLLYWPIFSISVLIISLAYFY